MVDTVLMFEGEKHLNWQNSPDNEKPVWVGFRTWDLWNEWRRIAACSHLCYFAQPQRRWSERRSHWFYAGRGTVRSWLKFSRLSPKPVIPHPSVRDRIDARRLSMLIAVLEKRGGFRLNNQDVFLNITGGLKVEDPAVDLAVCISLISSLENRTIPSHVFAAEVGLGWRSQGCEPDRKQACRGRASGIQNDVYFFLQFLQNFYWKI